jgi:hypothetical protein
VQPWSIGHQVVAIMALLAVAHLHCSGGVLHQVEKDAIARLPGQVPHHVLGTVSLPSTKHQMVCYPPVLIQ